MQHNCVFTFLLDSRQLEAAATFRGSRATDFAFWTIGATAGKELRPIHTKLKFVIMFTHR